MGQLRHPSPCPAAQQFGHMVECIAADVATLLVDMTDLQVRQ